MPTSTADVKRAIYLAAIARALGDREEGADTSAMEGEAKRIAALLDDPDAIEELRKQADEAGVELSTDPLAGEGYTLAVVRAPVGGIRIGDKWFQGGMFIPGNVLARASQQEKGEIQGGMDSRTLAQWYADLFNAMQGAGTPPTAELVEHAGEELHGTGWALEHDEETGRWHPSEDEGSEEQGVTLATAPGSPAWQHAPTPHTQNRWYNTQTGKFRYQRNRPGSREHAAGHEARRAEHRGKRSLRGPVDREGLKARIEQHAHQGGLPRGAKQEASSVLRALTDHHGKQAIHRIEEIATEVQKALEGARATAVLPREQLRKYLAELHAMLHSKPERHSDEPEASPDWQAPDESEDAGRDDAIRRLLG